MIIFISSRITRKQKIVRIFKKLYVLYTFFFKVYIRLLSATSWYDIKTKANFSLAAKIMLPLFEQEWCFQSNNDGFHNPQSFNAFCMEASTMENTVNIIFTEVMYLVISSHLHLWISHISLSHISGLTK